MSKWPFTSPSKKSEHKKPGGLEEVRKDLHLLKSTLQAGQSFAHKNPEKAVQQMVMAGLKMASHSVFYNPLASPLKLADALKTLGIAALSWAPEVLMATIDQKFGGWTQDQAAEAIEHFHLTSTLKTEVPQLVREKIYAIRVIATSNSAQTEWHIFEKVGGAFNDRVAQFGVVESLTASECAKTVAIIEDIRPDTYENEIKAYIGAACHTDGLYTVSPVKWLALAETYLQQMNFEATGDHVDPDMVKTIADTLSHLRATKTQLRELEDSLVEVQASKLLAIEEYAAEVEDTV